MTMEQELNDSLREEHITRVEAFRQHLTSLPYDHVLVEQVKNDPVWAAYPDEEGILRGANGMGKILTICRRCIDHNTEPNIDRDLLKYYNIHILGERVEF